jgi:uncharacterized repeat protein (TIGR01451 family)
MITYTLTITNHGPAMATGVTVTDTLPSGVTFYSSDPACTLTGSTLVCELGLLNNGESTQITVLAVVASYRRGALINRATVGADQDDPASGNNTASVTSWVEGVADLVLTKTDDPDPVFAGDYLTYTLVVTNTGPSLAVNAVITDVLPADVTYVSTSIGPAVCLHSNGTVTCVLGGVFPGQSITVAIRVLVDDDKRGTITNSATVSSEENDPVPENNTVIEETAVTALADVALGKIGEPIPMIPGDLITYTLTVTNYGPSKASDIVLTDTLPAGVTFVGSEPGAPYCTENAGEITCHLSDMPGDRVQQVFIYVSTDALMRGTLTNRAGVYAYEEDPDLENNFAWHQALLQEVILYLPLICK